MNTPPVWLQLKPRFFLIIATNVLILANFIIYVPQLQQITPILVIGMPLTTLSFIAMLWLATRAPMPAIFLRLWQSIPPILRTQRVLFYAFMPFLAISAILTIGSMQSSLTRSYVVDSVAYLHLSAEDVLHGINPYTDNTIIYRAILRWPNSGGTPLQRGAFKTCNICYPTSSQLKQVLIRQALNPSQRGPEFDPQTGHNYPAGSFLIMVPFIWANVPNMMLLDVLATMLILAMCVIGLPKMLWFATVTAGISLFMATMTSFDAICIVFVVAAWQWMNHRWRSAILLGIGIAIKQIAWFFLPFYLVEIWRKYGYREAILRTSIIAAVFVLPNAPFIIMSPHAWLTSMLVPMTDPMFPEGFGIVSLFLSGFVALPSPLFFSIIEFTAWIGVIWHQAARKDITSDGILLALAPLYFARRDSLNYIVILPLLALWLAAQQYRSAPAVIQTQQKMTQKLRVIFPSRSSDKLTSSTVMQQ